jgi:hypothetical protein
MLVRLIGVAAFVLLMASIQISIGFDAPTTLSGFLLLAISNLMIVINAIGITIIIIALLYLLLACIESMQGRLRKLSRKRK